MTVNIGTLLATVGMDVRPLEQAVAKAKGLFSQAGQSTNAAAQGHKQLNQSMEATRKAFQQGARDIGKYGLVIGQVTGSLGAAGINVGKTGKAVNLLSSAMVGAIGPVGLLAAGVGALVAAILSANKAAENFNKKSKETTDALITQLAQTGAVTEAEKKLTAEYINGAEAQVLFLRARQKVLESDGAQLSFFEALKIGLSSAVEATKTLSNQTDIYNRKIQELIKAKTGEEYSRITNELEALEQGLKDAADAQAGGTNEINKAKQAANEHAAALAASESRIQSYAAATAQAVDATKRIALAQADSAAEITKLSQERLDSQLKFLADEYSAKVEAIGQEKLAEREKADELLALGETYSAQIVALTEQSNQDRLTALDTFYDAAAKKAAEAQKKEKEALDASVEAYRDGLANEQATANEKLAVWENYKAARIEQITAEVTAMREAGVDSASIAQHVQNSAADLAQEQQQLLSSQTKAFEGLTSFLGAMNQQFETAADFLLSLINTILPLIAKSFADAKAAADALSIAGNIPLFGSGGGGGGASGVPDANFAYAPTAAGGIFMGPSRRLIGEAGPEAVIPLDRLRDPSFVASLTGAANGTDGGGGNTNNFYIQSDDVGGVLRSQQQIMARASLAALQAARRNG